LRIKNAIVASCWTCFTIIKIEVFWNVTPHSLVDRWKCYRGSSCHNLMQVPLRYQYVTTKPHGITCQMGIIRTVKLTESKILPVRSLAHWLFSVSEAAPEPVTVPSRRHSVSVGPASEYFPLHWHHVCISLKHSNQLLTLRIYKF
jgi:hypothetical protein